MISRYSSRRDRLDRFLPPLLQGATKYDRIAGYFRSSILEVAGDGLEQMAAGITARIICNSDLHPLDIMTARAAQQAMYREWKRDLPEDIPPAFRDRLASLYQLLTTGKMEIRVLPDELFGFAHGKAGVIQRADGSQIAFLGSANESRAAWTLNYELLWCDESLEGITWVQEEFDALWNNYKAQPLADAVITDVGRLTRRTFIPSTAAWRAMESSEPAAAVAAELPIYRRENGLWAHQKFFVHHAFMLHQQGGARLVLADQVGLGKTVQLALAAKLMALWGDGRVLVIAPKTLLTQWQEEIWSLLELPSARWTGRSWIDEQGVAYPVLGPSDLKRCPRRVGLVSAGLVTQNDEVAAILSELNYECVIFDEAHRARRRNLGTTHQQERADPNKLLRFAQTIAPQTRSMLLATATPVQLDPIEAWDLLDALNHGNDTVLGSQYSPWIRNARQGLYYILGRDTPPTDLDTVWEWIRDPLPPGSESHDFQMIRRQLGLRNEIFVTPELRAQLDPPNKRRLNNIANVFFTKHNPYIRHIIRRTREFLETTIDPQTNEPYLQPIHIHLFGEEKDDSLILTGFLGDAYIKAEEFCNEVGRRQGIQSGFLKTILLRRLGSTVEAGRVTATKMMREDLDTEEEEEEEPTRGALYPLLHREIELLEGVLRSLEHAREEDPKYRIVEQLLLHGIAETGPWLERGCIIFSQYLDSARWVAQLLSHHLLDIPIGLYASAASSGIFRNGLFTPTTRETLKNEVRRLQIRLLIGTDAASEGLNLQSLGTLINLDLPWNPTRLEQRKGRIQRIGQLHPEIFIYNMRYRDSVEDRVHQLLSGRLQAIHAMFGQLPDTLDDLWIALAEHDEVKAREVIDQLPTANPFEYRYDRIETIDWESHEEVLHSREQLPLLLKGW